MEARLLRPLGMSRWATNFGRLLDACNAALPYVPVAGRLVPQPRYSTPMIDPAGIWRSARDLLPWVRMLLGSPGAPAPLLKPATQRELWTPQTLLPAPAPGPTALTSAPTGPPATFWARGGPICCSEPVPPAARPVSLRICGCVA